MMPREFPHPCGRSLSILSVSHYSVRPLPPCLKKTPSILVYMQVLSFAVLMLPRMAGKCQGGTINFLPVLL